jgi:hypothetical protein
MKPTNYEIILSLTAMLLFLKLDLNGQLPNFQVEQDSYGTMCNLGREIMVLKNKNVVEFLVPVGWQRDHSLLKSLRVEMFYPEIDSIKRATIISIHNSPYLGSKTNIDSIIQNDKTNYPKDWKFIEWDTQKNPFHSSVPNGKLFLVKDHDNIVKESIAYISSNDYTIAFAFKPSNSGGYNDYIGVYATFLSSIRCSEISR